MKKLLTIFLTVLLAVTTITFNVAATENEEVEKQEEIINAEETTINEEAEVSTNPEENEDVEIDVPSDEIVEEIIDENVTLEASEPNAKPVMTLDVGFEYEPGISTITVPNVYVVKSISFRDYYIHKNSVNSILERTVGKRDGYVFDKWVDDDGDTPWENAWGSTIHYFGKDETIHAMWKRTYKYELVDSELKDLVGREFAIIANNTYPFTRSRRVLTYDNKIGSKELKINDDNSYNIDEDVNVAYVRVNYDNENSKYYLTHNNQYVGLQRNGDLMFNDDNYAELKLEGKDKHITLNGEILYWYPYNDWIADGDDFYGYSHLYEREKSRTKVAIIPNENLVYTGEVITPFKAKIHGLDFPTDFYKVEYKYNDETVDNVVNAGEYTATLTIKEEHRDSYFFEVGGNETHTCEVSFTVSKKQLDKPSLKQGYGTYVYSGESQGPQETDLINYDANIMERLRTNDDELVSVWESVNVGNYKGYVDLKDKTNHEWKSSDQDPVDINWSIIPTQIIAHVENHEYDSKPYDPVIKFTCEGSDVTDKVNKEVKFYLGSKGDERTEITEEQIVDPGTYSVNITLTNDPKNYCFGLNKNDELSESNYIEYDEDDYIYTVDIDFKVTDLTYDAPKQCKPFLTYKRNTYQTPTFEGYDEEVMTMLTSWDDWGVTTKAINAGTYIVKFKLNDPNAKWAEGTKVDGKNNAIVEWKIKPKQVTLPKEGQSFVFDGNNHQPQLVEGLVFASRGQNRGKDAGDYKAWVTLESSNYAWPEGFTPKHYKEGYWPYERTVYYFELPWKIEKANAKVYINHDKVEYGTKVKDYQFVVDKKDKFYGNDFDLIKNYIEVFSDREIKNAGYYQLNAKLNIPSWNKKALQVENNYNITFKGNLRITPVILHVSLEETKFEYNGKVHEPKVIFDEKELKYDDKITAKDYVAVYNPLSNSVDAGYKVVYVGLLGNIAHNYELDKQYVIPFLFFDDVKFKTLTYTISRKVVTAEWFDDGSFVYDGHPQSPTLRFRDENGDVLPSLIGVSPIQIDVPLPDFENVESLVDKLPKTEEEIKNFNRAMFSFKDVGEYVTCTFLLGNTNNYVIKGDLINRLLGIKYSITNFEITPRPLTVIWDTKTKFPYDGNKHAPEVKDVVAMIDGVEKQGIVTVDKKYVTYEVEGQESSQGGHTAKVVLKVSPHYMSYLLDNYEFVMVDGKPTNEIYYEIYKVVPHKDPVKTGIE